jgi:D-alanyl-D-alanine dipeptidase
MNDETARRAYWVEQMELAYQFMQSVREYPVRECGEPLASMVEAADNVEVEFSTSKIAGDLDRVFYLRAGLLPNFVAVARAMNERGWILKVEDGFRSVEMQTALARKPNVFDTILERVTWENGGATPSGELMLRRLGVLCATTPKVGTHMSGSAIDISVLRRDDGAEVERGGPYLEMSELTPMDSPFVSSQAHENRRQITELMTQHGFVAYPFEFWHYNAGDAYDEFLHHTGRPARYGAVHWDGASGTITPVQNPTQSLQPEAEVERCIAAALHGR